MVYVLIIFLQILLFSIALHTLIRKPFDIGTILVLLFIVFYCFPAWDFYFGGNLFSEYILYFYVGYSDKNKELLLIFIATLIMITFYLGYRLMMNSKDANAKDRNEIKYEINYKMLHLVQIGIISLWLGVLIFSISRYDHNFLLFFSPSRKEGLFESTYIEYLYKLLPLTLLIIKIVKDIVENGKIKKGTFAFILIPLAAYMTTGQRREILNLIIFIVTMYVHMKIDGSQSNKSINVKYKRKKLFQLGYIAVALIPILWWSRVVFTQLQRNSDNIIMPWLRRGFLELLFGSSSGGYKTLLLGLEHKDQFGLQWGYSLYFLLSSFIPRSIMPDKPLVINKLWQNAFGLSGNPSTFYINEMYINFGISSLLVSALFGVTLSYVYNKLYNSPYIIWNVFAFIIFSNVITLFKNGFTQFTIIVLMSIIIIGIPCSLIFSRKIESRET